MSKRSSTNIPDASSGTSKKQRIFLDEETGERLQGIRIWTNKSGMTKYGATTYDPTTRKKTWIGAFDTMQQASEAYKARKKELSDSSLGDEEIGEFDIRSRVFDDKGERITGVWRTKTGNRYDTKIRDPYTRLDIWIGTFDTIEQASEAYNAKKRELETDHRTLNLKIGKLEQVFDEKSGKRIAGVWEWTAARRYITKIRHPASKKYVCLGSFDSYQKASEAYQAKKKEFQAARMRKVVKEFEWVETDRVSDTIIV